MLEYLLYHAVESYYPLCFCPKHFLPKIVINTVTCIFFTMGEAILSDFLWLSIRSVSGSNI